MKKRNYLRLVCSLVIILLLSTLFAGCGAKDNAAADTKGTESTVKETAATSEETAKEEPKKDVKLLMWQYSYLGGGGPNDKSGDVTYTYLKDVIDKYKTETGVEVEYVFQDTVKGIDLFKVSSASGEGPDIYESWAGGALDAVNAWLEPLDPYFTKEELEQYSGVLLCRKGFMQDGVLLGLPVDNYSNAIAYNVDLFKKAGIENPAPKSFDELLQIADKLKAAGITPFLITNKEGHEGPWFLGSLISQFLADEGLVKLRSGELKWTGSGIADIFNKWNEISKKDYCNKDAVTASSRDKITLFASGKYAMTSIGTWHVTGLTDNFKKAGLQYDIFAIPPINPADKYAMHQQAGPGNCLTVTNYSKNKEEAVKFIKWLNNEENSTEYVRQTNSVVSHIRANALNKDPMIAKALGMLSEYGEVNWIDNILSGEQGGEYYKLVNTFFGGKITGEEACQFLDKRFDELKK